MSIWRWAKHFSDADAALRVTLGEGETPFVRSKRIGPSVGLNNLWFKLEGANPTGSYKDRFASAAITEMLAQGKSRCVATSSGNTGAALAAYCAAANIACEIAIVETAPPGKLKQMMAYGADIFMVRGFGLDAEVSDKVFGHIESANATADGAMQISCFKACPVGMAGVKTISHELAEAANEQGVTLDHVFVPAGGGGLTLAIARGFVDMVEAGAIERSPRIECVQPEGNDTIATPLRDGAAKARAVDCTSDISGLQVPSVLDGDWVVDACRVSGGTGHTITDEQTYAAQKRLAREEGIFCEPAAAVALAGAIKAAANGEIAPDAHVVCIVTGVGFKDPPSVDRMLADVECPTISVDELLAR